ncbi:hypothetical protein M9458_047253, partial [Cirrhinus mrigala]
MLVCVQLADVECPSVIVLVKPQDNEESANAADGVLRHDKHSVIDLTFDPQLETTDSQTDTTDAQMEVLM